MNFGDLRDVAPPTLGKVNLWYPTSVFFNKYVTMATVQLIPKDERVNAVRRIAGAAAILSICVDNTSVGFAVQVAARSPTMMSNACLYLGLLPVFPSDGKHVMEETVHFLKRLNENSLSERLDSYDLLSPNVQDDIKTNVTAGLLTSYLQGFFQRSTDLRKWLRGFIMHGRNLSPMRYCDQLHTDPNGAGPAT